MKPKMAAAPRYNWIWPNKSFAFIGVPKCGSMTMRKALACSNGVVREKTHQMACRLAVIRDPVERAVSAHAHGWPDVPIEDWWLEVKRDLYFDVHTTPYTDWLGCDANRIVCIEDIDEWWPDLRAMFRHLPSMPPHENRAKAKATLSALLAHDIAKVYRRDIALFGRARHTVRAVF